MRAIAKFWGFYICVYLLVLAWGYYRGLYTTMNTNETIHLVAGVAGLTFMLAVISRVLLLLWDTKRVVAKFICLLIAALITLFVLQQLQPIFL